MSVDITYKLIDGAHFFTTSDKKAAGFCVAHNDLKTAYEEVGKQLTALWKHNHGEKVVFTPAIPFEKFASFVRASHALIEIADEVSTITPASVQPWMVDAH